MSFVILLTWCLIAFFVLKYSYEFYLQKIEELEIEEKKKSIVRSLVREENIKNFTNKYGKKVLDKNKTKFLKGEN